jgi:predicted DNA-binding protein with PD1-like motif
MAARRAHLAVPRIARRIATIVVACSVRGITGLRTHADGRHGISPLRAHTLRLLPGDDLIRSLRAFALEQELQAACVLSCVGSTSLTTLRPAGQSEARTFDGKYEIISLVGTLSAHAHHLHMSVSDESCRVLGGHVLEGCTVRTTAEIVLGELEGLRFDRRSDDRTGFRELFIEALADPPARGR